MRKIPGKLLVFLMAIGTFYVLIEINVKWMRPYVIKFKADRQWYLHRKVPCSRPKPFRQAMVALAADTSRVLEHLGIASAACFGTLIGVLRRGDVLPWDTNVDLCIVDRIPGNFAVVSEVFARWKIQIQAYDSWQGHYRIQRDNTVGFINVFTNCRGRASLRAISISLDIHRLYNFKCRVKDIRGNALCPDGILPLSAQKLDDFTHPFPAALLQGPFPSLRLGNESIHVPHEDADIVKYQYPDSWWLDVKPTGC